MVPLKKYEGLVDEVMTDSFNARLIETWPQSSELEFCEIQKSYVKEKDIILVVSGAIFHFTVGYEIKHGQTKAKIEIDFDYHPPLSGEEILAQQNRIKNLMDKIVWAD